MQKDNSVLLCVCLTKIWTHSQNFNTSRWDQDLLTLNTSIPVQASGYYFHQYCFMITSFTRYQVPINLFTARKVWSKLLFKQLYNALIHSKPLFHFSFTGKRQKRGFLIFTGVWKWNIGIKRDKNAMKSFSRLPEHFWSHCKRAWKTFYDKI